MRKVFCDRCGDDSTGGDVFKVFIQMEQVESRVGTRGAVSLTPTLELCASCTFSVKKQLTTPPFRVTA